LHHTIFSKNKFNILEKLNIAQKSSGKIIDSEEFSDLSDNEN
jgi:hypothetical protein